MLFSFAKVEVVGLLRLTTVVSEVMFMIFYTRDIYDWLQQRRVNSFRDSRRSGRCSESSVFQHCG